MLFSWCWEQGSAMSVCELGHEASAMEDLKGQKSDALEIKCLLFGQLRCPAAAFATDALGEPPYHVEAKAGLFAVVGLGAPRGVPQGIRSLVNLAKRILAIMGLISSRRA